MERKSRIPKRSIQILFVEIAWFDDRTVIVIFGRVLEWAA